jgi:hypothetical protein
MTFHRTFLAAVVLAAVLPTGAARAETAQTCTGFIDTVPAVITTQGVWCLRRDLVSNQTSGRVIDIQANNVTIDCNGFKLGGLAAGDYRYATGIGSENANSATVRNCTVRGYLMGIGITGAGTVIEDNLVDQSGAWGVYAWGDGVLVRRNRIFATGGAVNFARGVVATGDVVDNTISRVSATANADADAMGIFVNNAQAMVLRNRVTGVVATNPEKTFGINVYWGHSRIEGNHVYNPTPGGVGISGVWTNPCLHNTVGGYATPVRGCLDMATQGS